MPLASASKGQGTSDLVTNSLCAKFIQRFGSFWLEGHAPARPRFFSAAQVRCPPETVHHSPLANRRRFGSAEASPSRF